jgi:hypothetical protein
MRRSMVLSLPLQLVFPALSLLWWSILVPLIHKYWTRMEMFARVYPIHGATTFSIRSRAHACTGGNLVRCCWGH